MKQVIPFKKDIIFKTKISDITSISLEHTLSYEDDSISGDFILSGDYKMTDASINKEDFYYKLPFDIALDCRYDTSKLKIEIEDFYYEIINSDVLRVNIEVSLDGLEEYKESEEDEEIDNDDYKEPTILDIDDNALQALEEKIDSLQEDLVIKNENLNKINKQNFNEMNNEELNNEIKMPQSNFKESSNTNIEEIEEIIENQSEEINMKNQIKNNNIDTKEIKSLFSNLNEEETFSTYHVYIMRSEDTLESVVAKYNISKEILSKYNDIDNIKLGDKLIIPALIND